MAFMFPFKKEDEDKFKDPLGLTKPVDLTSPAPKPGPADPLGLTQSVFDFPNFTQEFARPSPPPPHVPGLGERALDLGGSVLEQLRGMFTPEPRSPQPGPLPPTDPRESVARFEEIIQPTTPPPGISPPSLPTPGPVPEGVRGRDTTMHTPTGVEDKLGFVLKGLGSTVGIQSEHRPAESWDEQLLEMVGSFIPYVLAGKVLAPAKAVQLIPTLTGGSILAKSLKLTPQAIDAIGKIMGTYGRGAALGGGVAAVRETVTALSEPETAELGKAVNTITNEAHSFAMFRSVLSGIGAPIGAASEKKLQRITEPMVRRAIEESVKKGKAATMLESLVGTIVNSVTGGPPAGFIVGAMNATLNYINNPEEYTSDMAVDQVATSTLWYTGLNLMFGLLGVPSKAGKRYDTIFEGYRDTLGSYDILGVPRGAPLSEVKKAYRKLAYQFHPDQNIGDLHAEAKFKEVARAYKLLQAMFTTKTVDHPAMTAPPVGTPELGMTATPPKDAAVATTAQAPVAQAPAAQPVTTPVAKAPTPIPAAERTPMDLKLRAGQVVHHKTFGIGSIQDIQGLEDGSRAVTVNFDEHGVKKVMGQHLAPTDAEEVAAPEAPAPEAPAPLTADQVPGTFKEMWDRSKEKDVPFTPVEAQKKLRESKRVYLAGPIRGVSEEAATGWRNNIAQELSKYEIESLDPMRNQAEKRKPDGTIDKKKVVELDYPDIKNSDALIVYKPFPSDGTTAEIVWTSENFPSKPIYVIKDPQGKELSPFVEYHANAIFESLEDFQAFLTADIAPDVEKPAKKPEPLVIKEDRDPELARLRKAWPSIFQGPKSMSSAEADKITTVDQLIKAIRARKKVPFSVVERMPQAIPSLLRILEEDPKAVFDKKEVIAAVEPTEVPSVERVTEVADPKQAAAEAEEQLKDIEAPSRYGTVEGKPVIVNMIVEDKKGNFYVVTKPREDGFVTVAGKEGQLRTFKTSNLKLPGEDAPTEDLPLAKDVKVPEEPKKKPVKKPVKKVKEPTRIMSFELRKGKKRELLTDWKLDTEDADTLEQVLRYGWTGLSPAMHKMRGKLLRSMSPVVKEPWTPEELVEQVFEGEIIETEKRAELNPAEISRLKAALDQLELQQLNEEKEVIGPQLAEFDKWVSEREKDGTFKRTAEDRWRAYEHMEESVRKYWGGNEAKRELKKISDKYEKLKGDVEKKLNRVLSKPVDVEKFTPSPIIFKEKAISPEVNLHPDSFRIMLQMLNHTIDRFYEDHEYIDPTGKLVKVVDPEWYTKTGFGMEALGRDAHLLMSGTTARSVAEQTRALAEFYTKLNKLRAKILDAAEKIPQKDRDIIMKGIVVAERATPDEIIIKAKAPAKLKDIKVAEEDNPFNPAEDAKYYAKNLSPPELAQQQGMVLLRDPTGWYLDEADELKKEGKLLLQVFKRRHPKTPWVVVDAENGRILKYTSSVDEVIGAVKEIQESRAHRPLKHFDKALAALQKSLEQSEQISLAKDYDPALVEKLKKDKREAITAEQAFQRAQLVPYTKRLPAGVSPTTLPEHVQDQLARGERPVGAVADPDEWEHYEMEEAYPEAPAGTYLKGRRGEVSPTAITEEEDVLPDKGEIFVEELMWPPMEIKLGARELGVGDLADRGMKQSDIINLFNRIPGALEFWAIYLDGDRGKIVVPENLKAVRNDLVTAMEYRSTGRPSVFKTDEKRLRRSEAYYKHFLNPAYGEAEAQLHGEKVLDLLIAVSQNDHKLRGFNFSQALSKRSGREAKPKLKPRWKAHWNRTGGRRLKLEGRTLKRAMDLAEGKKLPLEDAKGVVDELDKQFAPFHVRGSKDVAELTDKIDKLLKKRGVEEADRVIMAYNLAGMMQGAEEAGINVNLTFRLAPQIERQVEKDLYKFQDLTEKQTGKVDIKKDGKLFNVTMELLLSKDEPLVEPFLHELSHIWVNVWEASGSKDFSKMKQFLTDELIKAKGFSSVMEAEAAVDNMNHETMANLLTDYLLSGWVPLEEDAQAGKKDFFSAWAAKFKDWVSKVVERVQAWRERIWPHQPQYFKDQADKFSRGEWKEAFKNMEDKPFAKTHYLSKPRDYKEALKHYGGMFGREQELKFPTPIEQMSPTQKKNINKWIEEASQLLKLKSVDPEYKRDIASILDGLNWKALSVSEKKLSEAHNIKGFLKENSEWILPPRYIEGLEMLEKRPLGDLSYEEIELIFDAVRHVGNLGKFKHSLKQERKEKELNRRIEDSRKAVEKSHKIVVSVDENLTRLVETTAKQKPWAAALDRYLPLGVPRSGAEFLAASKLPEFIAQQLQGSWDGPIKKLVYDDVNEMSNQGLEHKHQAEDYIKERLELHLGKNWDDKVIPWSYKFNRRLANLELIEHKLPKSGKTIKLTRADRMAIYLLTKSGDRNLTDLLKGGFFLAWDKRQNAPHILPKQDIEYIISKERMPDEEKKIALDLFKFVNTVERDGINKVSERHEGITLREGKDRWPVARSKMQLKTEDIKHGGSEEKRATGMMSDLVDKLTNISDAARAPQSIYLRDVFDTFFQSAKDTSRFIAVTEPVDNLRALLKDGAFYQDLRAAGLEHYHKALEVYADDLVREAEYEGLIERTAHFLLTAKRKAILALQIFVPLKQPFSYFYSIETIELKHLLKGLKKKPDWERIKKAQRGNMRERGSGRINRSIGEIGEVGECLHFVTGKSFLGSKLTRLITEMDKLTVGRKFYAAESQVKAKNPDLKGDELDKEVAKVWEDTVQRVDPSYLGHTRTGIGRSNHVLVNDATSFTTQTAKILNFVMRSVWTLQNSAYTAKDIASFLLKSGIFFMAQAGIVGVDTFRDWVLRRPRKDWREQLERYLLNMMGLVYFGGPLSRSIYLKYKGGLWAGADVSTPLMTSVTQMGQAVAAIGRFVKDFRTEEAYTAGYREGQLKSPESFMIMIDETLKAVGGATGVPTENVMHMLEAQLSRMNPEMEFAIYTRTRNPQAGHYYSHLWEWMSRDNEKEAERAMKILVRHFGIEPRGLRTSWKAISKDNEDITSKDYTKALALYRRIKKEERTRR